MQRTRKADRDAHQRGFTLVELLMTLIISILILSALYSAYTSQQRSQTAQDQVVEVQQNLRAALEMMTNDIRTAGFDPTASGLAGIVTATKGKFRFTRDINDNGVGVQAGNGNVTDLALGENITYSLATGVGGDANGDGVADAGVAPLWRVKGTEANDDQKRIAENIQAIEFVYLLDSKLTPTLTPAASDLSRIRAVTISILSRASNQDPHFTNTIATYKPASVTLYSAYHLPTAANWGDTNNDHYRRRLYVTTIELRNMGL